MKNKRENSKKGFTLVELVVVLAIIAVLITIIVPGMLKYIERAKQQQVLVDCRAAVMAAETLRLEAPVGASNNFLSSKQPEILGLAGIDGKIVEMVFSQGQLIHLVYIKDRVEATYCRNYTTCNEGHKKVYTIT